MSDEVRAEFLASAPQLQIIVFIIITIIVVVVIILIGVVTFVDADVVRSHGGGCSLVVRTAERLKVSVGSFTELVAQRMKRGLRMFRCLLGIPSPQLHDDRFVGVGHALQRFLKTFGIQVLSVDLKMNEEKVLFSRIMMTKMTIKQRRKCKKNKDIKTIC